MYHPLCSSSFPQHKKLQKWKKKHSNCNYNKIVVLSRSVYWTIPARTVLHSISRSWSCVKINDAVQTINTDQNPLIKTDGNIIVDVLSRLKPINPNPWSNTKFQNIQTFVHHGLNRIYMQEIIHQYLPTTNNGNWKKRDKYKVNLLHIPKIR